MSIIEQAKVALLTKAAREQHDVLIQWASTEYDNGFTIQVIATPAGYDTLDSIIAQYGLKATTERFNGRHRQMFVEVPAEWNEDAYAGATR